MTMPKSRATPAQRSPGTSSAVPPTAGPDQGAPPDLRIRVVRKPHVGRLLGAALVLVVLAAALWSMITNPRFQWDVVSQWLTARTIMDGLVLTLWLTALSMAAGTVIGIVLAVMSSSRNRVLSRAAAAYVWFFRGTPLLVQLLFWFNMSAVYPRLVVGLPFGGPELTSFSANEVITPTMAAFLGLALHESAYMAEIVRAGILSVPPGQMQAATSLGMTRLQTMRKIVLPQAMRVIIPPTGNQTISMLKTTSLVSVLAIPDLLYSAQIIYSRTFQTIPLLIVATILYLITVSVLTVAQSWIERKFSPDADRPERRPRSATRRRILDRRPT
ncbi:polar amino acid ABC transporter inner membrane subunit [Streptomyces albus]|uniref:Polar amino acid ABC transporter inner membrane subunit n=2 Tax=Streptomyces TaxID=1883 RepID=A0A0B5ENS0_STRA4|nr:polar amino acid ABC transporter inner membrane subunit [Streptomyces albus]AOU74781.1 polar amino acid ABC transporter inner membrane subunit [Streptomyces albus]